ncbi:tetratricopeptide repeat protein, partial [Rubrivirga sp.]|uniref:tetratricopeptide repeat protein n=1 Tax=Rubrivirga sp. TaxID=1885344 RepID=UPI003C776742
DVVSREASVAGDSSALRSTTTQRLRRRLRGDLDQIVLKSLRQNPERRYRGAAELGADVQRHLDGLPIEARPESVGYRLGKFVRRNRALVAAAAVALIAVVGGAGVALWQAGEARAAQSQAEIEAATADEVSTFVTGLFSAADPDEAQGDTLTVLAALGLGAERARVDLADQPDVRAAVLQTIGDVYRDRGRLDLADSLLTEAAAIDAAPRVRADALEALGILRQAQGEYAATDSLYQLALGLRLHDLGPDHPDVASSHQAIGVLRRYQGEYEQAVASFQRALALRDRLGLEDDAEYATGLSALGVSLTRLNRIDEADNALRRSIGRFRVLEGDSSLSLASAYNNLGTLDHRREDYPAAEANYLRAIDVWRRILGPDHPNVAIGLSNVASMYIMVDEPGRARPFLEESLALFRSRYPETHPEVSFTLVTMSTLERIDGDLGEAARLARQALSAYAETLPPDHPYVGDALHGLGRTLRLQGDPDVVGVYRRALAVFEDALAPDDSRRFSAEIELAEILADRGQMEEARRLAQTALPHALEAEDEERIRSARAILNGSWGGASNPSSRSDPLRY